MRNASTPFFQMFRANSVNSQIVVAFFTLTALIIALEIFANVWIREMLVINSLKENFANLKEKQMQMKNASNEFILREKTNEQFFASGRSIFLDRYQTYFHQLLKNTDEICEKGKSLNAIDEM